MVTLVWGGGEGVLGEGSPHPPLVFNYSKEALGGGGGGRVPSPFGIAACTPKCRGHRLGVWQAPAPASYACGGVWGVGALLRRSGGWVPSCGGPGLAMGRVPGVQCTEGTGANPQPLRARDALEGGEVPPPPPLQGAQPMPSHCPPDPKCQAQWHL